jgi:hypothetical protein
MVIFVVLPQTFFESGDKTNFIVVLYAGYLLPLSIGLKQSNDGNNS